MSCLGIFGDGKEVCKEWVPLKGGNMLGYEFTIRTLKSKGKLAYESAVNTNVALAAAGIVAY